jgi:hypothetical protein
MSNEQNTHNHLYDLLSILKKEGEAAYHALLPSLIHQAKTALHEVLSTVVTPQVVTEKVTAATGSPIAGAVAGEVANLVEAEVEKHLNDNQQQ